MIDNCSTGKPDSDRRLNSANPFATNHQARTCQFIVNGHRCGVEFFGPPRRKYCKDHSSNIQSRGR